MAFDSTTRGGGCSWITGADWVIMKTEHVALKVTREKSVDGFLSHK